jgi:long-chain fatty acid transport protein
MLGRFRSRCLALALVLGGAEAGAAVLYTTDLEAVGLGQGGAFVAAPTTGAAVWYNPAAFAAQRGLRLELEGGLIFSPLHYDPDPAAPPVDNQDGIQPAGLAGVSWDFGRSDLTAGFFAYVPSSDTYHFDPEGTQRFQGVGGHYVLAFFHAVVAYRIAGVLSVGAALGPTYFHARQENVVSAAPSGLDPSSDLWSIGVTTEVSSPLFFTANLGLSYTPTEKWSFGASLMPPFDIDSSGTMTLAPSRGLAVIARIAGDGVKVHLRFPLIARAGVRFAPRPDLAFEVAGVYEGWSRFGSIDLQPDITVSAPALGIDAMKVPPISLPKGYRDVVSVRLGGEWSVLAALTLRAGAYYESSGSPTALFDITAPETDKLGLTLGATVRLGRSLFVDAALAHTFFSAATVSDSTIKIRNVLAPDNTAIVGNGRYDMSLTFAHLGLRLEL